jgi:hypothetical protein
VTRRDCLIFMGYESRWLSLNGLGISVCDWNVNFQTESNSLRTLGDSHGFNDCVSPTFRQTPGVISDRINTHSPVFLCGVIDEPERLNIARRFLAAWRTQKLIVI